MIVVIEGCDGTGKTTLANRFVEKMGARFYHCTADTPNDFEYFKEFIEESKHTHVVVDRFFYGQFVYQKPEERKLTKEELHRLELEVSENGIIIHATARCKDIKKRLNTRKEERIDSKEIKLAFSQLFVNSLFNEFFIWDSSREELKHVRREICQETGAYQFKTELGGIPWLQ